MKLKRNERGIPVVTRIDGGTSSRARRVNAQTHLKVSDLLRIGLLRVLKEFEETGTVSAGDGVSVRGKR